MYNKEKQIIVSSIAGFLILGCYSLYVYNNYVANNLNILNDPKFWGKAFLIMIPVSIVAQIIIQIVFAIFNKIFTNEDLSVMEDERDKLIELKAIRISHWIFIFGFLVAMASQAMGMQERVMFASLMLSGFISSTVSGIAKLYFYRRGF